MLQQFKDSKRWIIHGADKKPLSYKTGYPSDPTDPSIRLTYDEAVNAAIKYHGAGVGFVFVEDDDVIGIDLDDCMIDGQPNIQAQTIIDNVRGYVERSISGTGVHIITRAKLDRAVVNHDVGIEIYPHGRYFTFSGDEMLCDFPDEPQDISFLVNKLIGNRGAMETSELANLKLPLQGWDSIRIEKDLLDDINPDDGYDTWVRVGMALHHQYRGDDEGLALFERWSRRGEKFKEGECQAKWKSFRAGESDRQVTLASIIHTVKKSRNYISDIVRIADTHDFDIVCQRVKDDLTLSTVERAALVNAMAVRAKELSVPLGKVDLRKATQPTLLVHQDAPEFLTDWVYVKATKRFFNVKNGSSYDKEGFDNIHMEHSVSEAPSKLALGIYPIKKVEDTRYVPGLSRGYFTDTATGYEYFNIYENQIEKALNKEVGSDDSKYVEVFTNHLKYLTGHDESKYTHLINFLAHQIQKPGVKVNWTPLIVGKQGCGKSILGNLMSNILGIKNVKSITPDVLSSQFNGWLETCSFAMLEELRLSGHSKYEIVNKIKPIITQTELVVNEKFMPSRTVINACNFLALSNHADALPLEGGDRRWFVIQVPESQPVPNHEYFQKLWEAINVGYAAIAKYLNLLDLSNFEAKGHAPMTADKQNMADAGRSDLDDAILAILETGGELITKTMFVSNSLRNAVESRGYKTHDRTISNFARQNGFAKFKNRINLLGKAEYVWFKSEDDLNNWPNDEAISHIKNMMDYSVKDVFGEE